jgi:hypothetical protein
MRAEQWRDLLAPDVPVEHSAAGYQVAIGAHRAVWLAPDAFQASYGLPWEPAAHPFGELAMLNLLAEDPGIARQMLVRANRQVYSIDAAGEEVLVIPADARDGFVFSVRQYPVTAWLEERMAVTGETLTYAEG